MLSSNPQMPRDLGLDVRASLRQIPLAPFPPLQQDIAIADQFMMSIPGYSLTAVSRFSMTSLVLAAREYDDDDRNSDISKMDLAVAWGSMSSADRADDLKVSQRDRFYTWRYARNTGLTRSEVQEQTANLHLIPGSDAVAQVLKGIEKGQVAQFSGFLVNASSDDGWMWKTSMRRDDTGDGACELFFVTSIEIAGRAPQA